jgi:sulfate transporter 4
MGGCLIILLVSMKEGGKRVRRLSWLRTLGPITACVVGLLAVIIGNVDGNGIRTVGKIPSGEHTHTRVSMQLAADCG